MSASSCSICAGVTACAAAPCGKRSRHAGLGELAQPATPASRPRARSPAGTRSAARRARSGSGRRARSVFCSHSGSVERGQAAARAQVLLGVGLEREAAFGHRLAQARGGERVLQRLARAHVHQHVAGGDDAAAPVSCGDARRRVSTQLVVAGAVQQLEGDRGAVLEPGLQPHRVREHVLEAAAPPRARAAPGTPAGRRASARSAPCPRRRRDARGSCPSRRAGARP